MLEFVVIAFFFGLSAGAVAKIKGGSFLIWFLVGASLPGLGTIAALAHRRERAEPKRACEECGAAVPLHDQVCMRCGRDLDFPLEAVTPGGATPSA